MKPVLIPDAKGPPARRVLSLQVERQRRAARRMALQTIALLYWSRLAPASAPPA